VNKEKIEVKSMKNLLKMKSEFPIKPMY